MEYYDPHINQNIRKLWLSVIWTVYNHLKRMKDHKDVHQMKHGMRAYEWFTRESEARKFVFFMAEFYEMTPEFVRSKWSEDYEAAKVRIQEYQKTDRREESAKQARESRTPGKARKRKKRKAA